MVALRLSAALILLALHAPPNARAAGMPIGEGLLRWQPLVSEASQRFGIPERWIWRVMRAESGGNTHRDGRPIRSRAGAMGLMQLMPGTWEMLRVQHALGADPDLPRDNILAGTAYLRAMFDRFGYPGCIAAYHAGPGRYAAYLVGRARLPTETIAYLNAVTGRPREDRIAPVSLPSRELFVLRHEPSPSSEQGRLGPPAGGLFAIRKMDPG